MNEVPEKKEVPKSKSPVLDQLVIGSLFGVPLMWFILSMPNISDEERQARLDQQCQIAKQKAYDVRSYHGSTYTEVNDSIQNAAGACLAAQRN